MFPCFHTFCKSISHKVWWRYICSIYSFRDAPYCSFHMHKTEYKEPLFDGRCCSEQTILDYLSFEVSEKGVGFQFLKLPFCKFIWIRIYFMYHRDHDTLIVFILVGNLVYLLPLTGLIRKGTVGTYCADPDRSRKIRKS